MYADEKFSKFTKFFESPPYFSSGANIAQLISGPHQLEFGGGGSYCKMNNVELYIRAHCDRVMSALTEGDVEEIQHAKTDEERIRYSYQHAIIATISRQQNEKNYDVALQKRSAGNMNYQSKKFRTAFFLYNSGILRCPQDTDEGKQLYAVLIGNRSAVLYETRQYIKVCQDVKYIKELGVYPRNTYFKILLREAKSFCSLHRYSEALQSYLAANEALMYEEVSSGVVFQKQEEIKNAIEQVKVGIAAIPNEFLVDEAEDSEEGEPFTPNELYPAASVSVEFDEDAEQGRFARATRNIAPGELVIRELPHCLVISQENTTFNCTTCGVSTINPYPCSICCFAFFCSQECKRNATFHSEYECSIITTLYNSGASINCIMAVRILTQKGFDYFWQRRETLKNPVIRNLRYVHSDYTRVYNLCTNKDLRPKGEFVHYSFLAIFLLRLLKMTPFFGQETDDKVLTEEECFIGSLILRHLQILQFNAHEYFELRNCVAVEPNDLNYKSVHIGGALYPTLALFNHSCEPSIIRYFKRNKIVVRAIKYIKKGEIIYENYGPIYCSLNREERRNQLRERYWFTCQCVPCREDWPLFIQMQQTHIRIPCKSCGALNLVSKDASKPTFKCTHCKYTNGVMKTLAEMMKLEAIIKVADEKFGALEFKDAVPLYCKILKSHYTNLVPPFQDMVTIQQRLRTCMLHFGNKEEGYNGPNYVL